MLNEETSDESDGIDASKKRFQRVKGGTAVPATILFAKVKKAIQKTIRIGGRVKHRQQMETNMSALFCALLKKHNAISS